MVTPTLRAQTWRAGEHAKQDIFLHDHRMESGDTVLEIGAGCGGETVGLARRVGAAGRVIAVEAHPWTCELLRRTVEENDLDNVSIVHAAVCDHGGTVSISDLPPYDGIANSIVTPSGGIEVPALTIDDLVTMFDLERINLLKMNIEGAERAAVNGMTASVDLIRRAVISCHDFVADTGGSDELRTRDDVVTTLTRLGFDIERRHTDARPWVRDYLYTRRRATVSD